MNSHDIVLLYGYNDWANDRLLRAIAGTPPDVFTRDLGGGSFRSIRDVVAHIASADWIWLERWNGGSPSSLPAWYGSDSRETLLAQLEAIAAARGAFLQRLTAADLDRELSFKYLSGKPARVRFEDVLVHVVNHSTYHRGQLASMLRHVGTPPPPTDFIVFRTESPA